MQLFSPSDPGFEARHISALSAAAGGNLDGRRRLVLMRERDAAESAWFRVETRLNMQVIGERVRQGDPVTLVNVSTSRRLRIHAATVYTPSPSAAPAHEVFATLTSESHGFTMMRYRAGSSHASSSKAGSSGAPAGGGHAEHRRITPEELPLTHGMPLRLCNRESNSVLTAALVEQMPLDGMAAVAQQAGLVQCVSSSKASMTSHSLWTMEFVDPKGLRDGRVSRRIGYGGEEVRIRHLQTGRVLTIEVTQSTPTKQGQPKLVELTDANSRLADETKFEVKPRKRGSAFVEHFQHFWLLHKATGLYLSVKRDDKVAVSVFADEENGVHDLMMLDRVEDAESADVTFCLPFLRQVQTFLAQFTSRSSSRDTIFWGEPSVRQVA